jgi:hypothetical protein
MYWFIISSDVKFFMHITLIWSIIQRYMHDVLLIGTLPSVDEEPWPLNMHILAICHSSRFTQSYVHNVLYVSNMWLKITMALFFLHDHAVIYNSTYILSIRAHIFTRTTCNSILFLENWFMLGNIILSQWICLC